MVETRKSLAAYLTAALLSLAAAAGALELWRADLRIPFDYTCDAFCMQLWIKGLIDHGWYLTNPSVGDPFGLDMHDFPLVDSLFFLILKLVSRATTDPFLVENLYFLSTFPLTAVSALFVFRRFDVPRAPAVVASVLFACLPYHFLRREIHLFLASYFLVPLAVLVCLWVYRDGGILFSVADDGDSPRPRLRLKGGKAWGSLGISLLLSSGGVYYAFFSSYLLLAAGLGGSLRLRRWTSLASATLLVGVIGLGVLGNVAPKIVYGLRHGPNPVAVSRDPWEAELLGMKLAPLVLPVEGHRVEALSRLRQRYESTQNPSPFLVEIKMETLGAIGTLGFLSLLAGFLSRGRPGSTPHGEGLAVLNVAALLLALSGGLGALFSFLVSPLIRGYTRMSIFIAFLALFAVALALGRLTRRARTAESRVLVHMILGVLLIVGLWEQTTRAFIPLYPELQREFRDDQEFVRRVESSLPPRALVFQLPFTEFPEALPVGRMGLYDHLRLPLHSRTLRWSFGAMKGRYASSWHSEVAERSPEVMVRTLALAGFAGITIDRKGYVEQSPRLEAELARQLRVEPVVSRNGRYAFFDLAPYTAGLRRALRPEEWAAQSLAALKPVSTSWRGGFTPRQADIGGRWCGEFGELILDNPSRRPRRVELSLTLATKGAGPAQIRIEGPDGKTDYQVDAHGRDVRQTLVIPHGGTRLTIWCNGKPELVSGDPRPQVFRVTRYAVAEPFAPRRGAATLTAGPAAAAKEGEATRR